MEFTAVAITFIVIVLLYLVDDVTCHGGMLEPPMRSIMWRYGFDTPVNYDWMSLYCGGLNTFQQNGGKCGICGDPYQGPIENDKGGVYDTGIIVRHYPVGLSEIEVKIELTAHHKGFFQFKLCPNNENSLTQQCLDRHPMMIREGRLQGNPYRYLPAENPKLYELHVLLPPDVTCDRCVMQWTYTAGNSIGQTPDGQNCLGCGIQETFVNCADISIGGTRDRIPVAKLNEDESGREVVIPAEEEVTNAIINSSPDATFQDIIRQLQIPIFDTMARASSLTDNRNVNRDADTWVGADLRTQMPSANDISSQRAPRIDFDRSNRVLPNDVRPPSAIDDRSNNGPTGNGNHLHERTMFDTNVPRSRANNNILNIRAGRPRSHAVNIQPNSRNDLAQNGILPPSRMPFPTQQRRMHDPTRDMSGVFFNHGPQENLLATMGPLVRDVRNRNRQLDSRNRLLDLRNPQFASRNPQLGPINPQLDPRNPQLGSFQAPHEVLTRRQTNIHSAQMQRESLIGRDIFGNPTRRAPAPTVLPQLQALRQTLPRGVAMRRGDGMTSHREAVRHAPHLARYQFSIQSIREQVPDLPQDIGPPQDQSSMLGSDQFNFRDSRHPDSRLFMQQQRMNNNRQRQSQSRLPRRIVVHNMEVAQHLLRKYPVLKGRVFLSRGAHERNQLGHMLNKYRQRQRWV